MHRAGRRRCSAIAAAYAAAPSRARSSVDPSTSVKRKVTVPDGILPCPEDRAGSRGPQAVRADGLRRVGGRGGGGPVAPTTDRSGKLRRFCAWREFPPWPTASCARRLCSSAPSSASRRCSSRSWGRCCRTWRIGSTSRRRGPGCSSPPTRPARSSARSPGAVSSRHGSASSRRHLRDFSSSGSRACCSASRPASPGCTSRGSCRAPAARSRGPVDSRGCWCRRRAIAAVRSSAWRSAPPSAARCSGLRSERLRRRSGRRPSSSDSPFRRWRSPRGAPRSPPGRRRNSSRSRRCALL